MSDKVAEGERERHLLAHSPDGHNVQSWVKARGLEFRLCLPHRCRGPSSAAFVAVLAGNRIRSEAAET